MAEDEGGDRTEAPTPHRREEARRQGQIAFSHDLVSSVLLLAAAAALALGGPAIGRGLLRLVRGILQQPYPAVPDPNYAEWLFAGSVGQVGECIGWLLGVTLLASVAAGLLQTGVYFNPDLLAFRWDRVAPKWERVLSLGAVVRGLIAVVKVVLVGALAYWVLCGRLEQIATLNDGTLARAVAVVWDLASRLLLALAGGLGVVGVLDYLWQRLRLERSLRMTKEEVREEIKREEGDPQIKARIRRLQREAAQARMMEEVPKATVVLTNPTHLALALRYDPGAMAAPRVVAKGAGPVARRIVELARRHNVLVVERPPLARALYPLVQLNQEVPAELYLAIAELLAYVYRLRPALAPRSA